ncbi:MAG: hypothetical protein JWN37_484 [Candidatus Nomurabacteria bacterium]|nr:hypothetical protein [Candidatus Nomurabacteria bacterium]
MKKAPTKADVILLGTEETDGRVISLDRAVDTVATPFPYEIVKITPIATEIKGDEDYVVLARWNGALYTFFWPHTFPRATKHTGFFLFSNVMSSEGVCSRLCHILYERALPLPRIHKESVELNHDNPETKWRTFIKRTSESKWEEIRTVGK